MSLFIFTVERLCETQRCNPPVINCRAAAIIVVRKNTLQNAAS